LCNQINKNEYEKLRERNELLHGIYKNNDGDDPDDENPFEAIVYELNHKIEVRKQMLDK
jgi:hypothetical protein